MNQFDFYVIEVACAHKRPILAALKALGLGNSRIDTLREGFKAYGHKRFPVYSYRATLAYLEAGCDREHVDKELARFAPSVAPYGLRPHARYIARD